MYAEGVNSLKPRVVTLRRCYPGWGERVPANRNAVVSGRPVDLVKHMIVRPRLADTTACGVGSDGFRIPG